MGLGASASSRATTEAVSLEGLLFACWTKPSQPPPWAPRQRGRREAHGVDQHLGAGLTVERNRADEEPWGMRGREGPAVVGAPREDEVLAMEGLDGP